MAQARTTAFAAQADAATSEPVILARLLLSGLTKYLATRAGTYGGVAYEELLGRGITLSMGADHLGRVQRNVGSLEILNGDDNTGQRFSDLMGTYEFVNAAVEVDQIFQGLALGDALRVFAGVCTVPETDAFDDVTASLGLLDDGQPAKRGPAAEPLNRIHKYVGAAITRTDWPKADPDVVGRAKPIVYGSVIGAHALPVDAGVVDKLQADITSSQTTLQLSDPILFGLLPASGTLQIEAEQVTYSSLTASTLTVNGLTRGTGGTTAAAHVKGREVWAIQGTYTYIVADHACKAINAVYVDGIKQASGYTVDLTGPTKIVFTAKPKRDLANAVQTQPVHASTVTAEQSPGAISTTAEQSPGGISTTAEHGHSTAEGSHSHTGQKALHEYINAPSLPFTKSTALLPFGVTFANSPLAGTSANIHIRVETSDWVSGKRYMQLKRGGVLIIDNITTVDDYYAVDSSPGTSYTLDFVTGAGDTTIKFAMIDRDITVSQSTDAGAASGVLASRTGATASSMASLAGATATSMASLAGSTAVSTSRTVDVIVSPADIEVGEVVTCDVDGYADDGSGTYTGTPNALITNPADQLKHLIAVRLGLALATYADSASFTQARADFNAAGIRADWALYDFIDSSEIFERLRWSVASRLFLSADGKFKIYVLPPPGSSLKTFTESDDVLGPEAGGGPIRPGRSDLSALLNHILLVYRRHITDGEYTAIQDTKDQASVTKYRTENALEIENDFVRDDTAAAAIAAKYLAWHKDAKWMATFTAYGLPTLHLELFDQIAISSPRMPGGGWAAKPFYIQKIERRLGEPGDRRIDSARLVCREV